MSNESVEKCKELKKKFLQELKEALQNNIPYAVNSEFPAFINASEKGLDKIITKAQEEAILEERKRIEEAVKEMKKDNITAGRIGQITRDDCIGYSAACGEFIRIINQKNV